MFVFNRLKGIYSRAKIFSRNESGTILIIFALALIPLMGFLGLSVDIGRAYYINSVLSGAVDSAAIAGGRAGGTQANVIAQAKAVFNANIPQNFIGTITGPNIAFLSDDTVIKVSATAKTDTYFLTIFGIPTLATTGSAAVRISSTGAEVVLALDNTGSMAGSPMQGEIAAAKSLVNILYGGDGTTGGVDTVKGLFVGVVPYTTTVNIGTNNSKWLTTLGVAQIANTNLYPTTVPATATNVGSRWMGCVEARAPKPTTMTGAAFSAFGYTDYAAGPPTLDSLDTAPTSDATKFTPFLYPSTRAHKYTAGQPLNRVSPLAVLPPPNASASPPWLATKPIPQGDNDWTLAGGVATAGLFFGDNYGLQSADGNKGAGPNLGCPIPILPLQTSQAVVQSTISNMKATYRGGTMINIGLNAAWWVISPNWTGLWPAPAPAPVPAKTLPQAYDKTLKVVVLMTDGQNEWYDMPNGMPGAPATTAANGQNDADYTGYGRILEGRSGTTAKANVGTFLNSRMSGMCTTLKNNKVIIYAIIFGSSPNSATQTLFQNCATAPTYYYYAPNNATLLSVFKKIGQEISSLRLTWPASNS